METQDDQKMVGGIRLCQKKVVKIRRLQPLIDMEKMR